MKKTQYTKRLLARVVLEATTPLAIGNGDKDIFTDALVATDANGLPYLPGTSIAGILRHAAEEAKIENVKQLFGYQEISSEKEERSKTKGQGSELIFSEGKMVGPDGQPIDGLEEINYKKPFFAKFKQLPIRQHVRIGSKGTVEGNGKFDGQVVYKGTRFVFETELVSKNAESRPLEDILNLMHSPSFRLGSGSRHGLGEFAVREIKTCCIDLEDEAQRKAYMEKSSGLEKVDFWKGISPSVMGESAAPEGWTRYELTLTPEDFFLFGSGFGDDDADMTPVKEDVIVWDKQGGHFEENCTLIPASSLKGALAHRTAFFINKNLGVFADFDTDQKKEDESKKLLESLFGSEGRKEKNETVGQKRGSVLFSDIIEAKVTDKLLNHVSIDRFTGGAIDGAKFDEKASYAPGQTFKTSILLDKNKCSKEAIEAFEIALQQLCNGMLPLGGGVNRGHGVFKGDCKGLTIVK